jgi:hypothetical protein
MRFLSIVSVLAAVLLLMISPARPQSIPNLNVTPVCRGISKHATKTGEPYLTFAACVKNEQAMRKKLIGEWSTFSQSEKANCIGDEAARMPSYTDLVSCLEVAREAKQLNRGK